MVSVISKEVPKHPHTPHRVVLSPHAEVQKNAMP